MLSNDSFNSLQKENLILFPQVLDTPIICHSCYKTISTNSNIMEEFSKIMDVKAAGIKQKVGMFYSTQIGITSQCFFLNTVKLLNPLSI